MSVATLQTATPTAIDVTGLTKRFGDRVVVEDLTFSVPAGLVTGFLGPNGAGKTTTLRLLLGLAAPDAGEARILGRRYAELDHPGARVGVLLETGSFHPGRSGRDHLRIGALLAGLDARRVDAVLEQVELTGDADRRIGEYSLGMRQRLGLAAALLGDPEVVVLDEPANGLDPAGIRWLRDLLRGLADEGRTVLLSSHVLSEIAQIVDRVVVLAGGRLRADATLEEFVAGAPDPQGALEERFLQLTGDPDAAVVASPAPAPAPPPAAAPPPGAAVERRPVREPTTVAALALADEAAADAGLAALRWPPEPRVVAVVGTKGGAGRTTVALALADALAEGAQRRVAVVDGDPDAGTLLALAGPRCTPGLDGLADHAAELDTLAALGALATRRASGADVYGFAPGTGPSALGAPEYAVILDRCLVHYEVVVVDLGDSPFSPLGGLVLSRTHQAVVVTPPDQVGFEVTAALLRALDASRTTLLVNDTGAGRRAEPTDDDRAPAELACGPALHLPTDPGLADAPWEPAALSGATRLAVKRLGYAVAAAIA